MSTSKHIDKICIAVVILTLILTVIFMNGERLGLSVTDNDIGYESLIFSTDRVHKIDIVMNDWDSFIQNCESEEYSCCNVAIDGEKVSNIGIRAKGNTSLSSVRQMGSERYSLKLEFDQYEKGKTYHGLDKMCLNNLIQDNTMMKDYLVYRMMDEFGADTPLCSYAYVTVNGEDWGLFLAVESVEDSFLERNYGSKEGELYKPDTMNFGGGRGNGKGFEMPSDFDFDDFKPGDMPEGDFDFKPGDMPEGDFDFRPGDMPEGDFDFKPGDMPEGDFDFREFGNQEKRPESKQEDSDQKGGPGGRGPKGGGPGDGGPKGGGPGGFGGMGSDDVKLKYIDDDPDSYRNIFSSAKTEVSNADKKRLISSLKNLSEYTDLESSLDMEEVLRYFVVHNFVVNGDSYTGSMIHNYYLHESDGKLGMIPWDYNLAFGTFMGGNASSSVNESIDSPVSGGNVDDRPMVGWIFSDEKYTSEYHVLFEEFLDEWYENGKLSSMIDETYTMLKPYVDKDPTKFCTTEEYDKGVSALKEFVSLRFEAVKKQLSGDNNPVNTEGLNTSDMGTMNKGMGRGF